MYKSRAAGWRNYLAAASTQASFTLALGSFSVTDIKNHLREDAFYLDASTTVLRAEHLSGWRGIVLRFYGTTTQDTTADFKLWGVMFEFNNHGPEDSALKNIAAYSLSQLGSGTITLGNKTTAGVAGSSSKWADTVTWTTHASLTATENARGLGNAGAYSPGSDAIARLEVPDTAFYNAWLLEFDMTGAVSMNAQWTVAR